MKKRIFLVIALSLALAGAASAQNHWASLEFKGPGAGLRYEFVVVPQFTIGGFASITFITIPIFNYQLNSLEFGATARWYPAGNKFFLDMSVGINLFEDGHLYDYDDRSDYEGTVFGICFAPGFGWTIDVGKMGGFFMSPGVKFPITLGDSFNLTVAPYLGFGFAF